MKNTIIIGAGIAGKELLRELRRYKKLGITLVGFIDDDIKKQRKNIQGLRVLGTVEELPSIIKEYEVKEVYIAIPSAKGAVINDIIEKCKHLKVSFKVVPRTLDIVLGKVSITNVRDVDVVDIIGREIAQTEQKALKKFFKGKTILVTGASGSIGREICIQLGMLNPKKLIFYDWWENGMFDLVNIFNTKFGDSKILPVIGDIKDAKKIQGLFKKEKINIVFHAAAYKHVPLMEEHPSEAVKNNVLGTKIVAEAARQYQTDYFVFISTDKAVRPKSIMGATKLIAEGIVHELSKNSQTKFISVRFGNVLDSFGSVLPLFRKQIQEGGPITITHKDMERYFMSIPEAVQLIFQSTMIGNGGEIFILDMGQPIKITKLAKLLIQLSGFTPEKDIRIVYTGLRPGEKLKEELFTKKENVVKTKNQRIFITKNFGINLHDLNESLDYLLYLATSVRDKKVKEEISRLIPTVKL